jgi:hypothetical protein
MAWRLLRAVLRREGRLNHSALPDYDGSSKLVFEFPGCYLIADMCVP